MSFALRIKRRSLHWCWTLGVQCTDVQTISSIDLTDTSASVTIYLFFCLYSTSFATLFFMEAHGCQKSRLACDVMKRLRKHCRYGSIALMRSRARTCQSRVFSKKDEEKNQTTSLIFPTSPLMDLVNPENVDRPCWSARGQFLHSRIYTTWISFLWKHIRRHGSASPLGVQLFINILIIFINSNAISEKYYLL